MSSTITASGIAATVAKVLSSAIDQPECQVGRLECLAESEESIIRQRNEQVASPYPNCLHDDFSDRARQKPTALAINAEDGILSYRELDALSTHLAVEVVTRGVRRASVVALCFEKSKYMIVSMLAVFKAGASCTMLEPSLPTERLFDMVRQVSADFLLVSSLQKSRFKDFSNVVEINEKYFPTELELKVAGLPCCSPSDAAIIIFTSGSTGKPKSILHEHSSIGTSLHALARRLKLDESTRILHFAAYSFDLSMIEILLPLIVGGCVCIPSEDSRINDLAGSIQRLEATFAMLTPSSTKLIRPKNVPSLEMIMVGGEPITGELIRVWGPHVTLVNAWGTAECGICTSVVFDALFPTSIGTCIEMGAWIVDPQNIERLLPLGAVGELIVEGPQVAWGYLSDPEKTRASFVDGHPWLRTKPRGRLYWTGDLMRYLSNGSVEYCGRKDSQVKIRGCRVELGEVEYHITADDLVYATLVSVPKLGIFQGKLVAVVQFSDQQQQPFEEGLVILSYGHDNKFNSIVGTLRTSLECKLPSQSVPETWIVVNRLPITKSDKIDRKRMNSWLEGQIALQHITNNYNISGNDFAVDRLGSDHLLSQVIQMLVAIVGPEASGAVLKCQSRLRSLGVTSLLIVEISARIEKSLKCRIPMKMLIDSSLTVEGLVDLVREQLSNGSGPPRSERSSLHPRTCNVLDDFRALRSNLERAAAKRGRGERIFLTGATGYIGSHILGSLVSHPLVEKIYVLVRAPTPASAWDRIIIAATNTRWWSNSALPKLEVWLGDLGQPHLGLSADHLRRLREGVDSIIHNGATVHWLADYEELRPINVSSSVELLNTVRSSPRLSSFIYMSTDPEMRFDSAGCESSELARYLSGLNGYRQTKAVSELLVRSMPSTPRGCRFSVIKPGFVIGSQEEGVVNVDDFIWRLATSAVRIHAYDSSAAAGWIYVASVDVITERIRKLIFDRNAEVEDVMADGINAGEFWKELESASGQRLRPLPHDEWLSLLRTDVHETGKRHPLHPLLHLIEDEHLTLVAKAPPCIEGRRSEGANGVGALRRGLQQLKGLGLLSETSLWLGVEGTSVFQRRGPCTNGVFAGNR